MKNAHTVLIPSSVAALNVDSYNRSFKNATLDFDNGTVFSKGALSTDAAESQVFMAELPKANESGLYMAFTAEDTIVTIGGNQYKFGLNDPRLFTNIKGYVFSGFRLNAGDIVEISTDGVTGEEADYVIADPTTGKLKFAAAQGTGLALKVISKSNIHAAGAGNGAIGGTQRLASYKLEVIAN